MVFNGVNTRMQRFLFTGSISPITRFCLFCVVCFVFNGFLSQSALSYEPFDVEKILGDPDSFMEQFEKNLETHLNQYLGAGVAITGLILVIRSTTN